MVAMLAFGGTFAYFTATTGSVGANDIKTATVQLGANSVAGLVKTDIQSGSKIADSVTVTNKSDVKTYIFVTFTVSMNKGTAVASKDKIVKEGDYCLDYTLNEGSTSGKWTKLAGVESAKNVYYTLADKATNTTDGDVYNVCSAINFYGMSNSTETSVGSLMGATITVTIVSESIQQLSEAGTNFASAADAYKALKGIA